MTKTSMIQDGSSIILKVVSNIDSPTVNTFAIETINKHNDRTVIVLKTRQQLLFLIDELTSALKSFKD